MNDNQYEKVTFSSDGKKLLAVDVDGNRVKIDQLPDDPQLLDSLTSHKVDVTVLPSAPVDGGGGVAGLAQSLVFPAIRKCMLSCFVSLFLSMLHFLSSIFFLTFYPIF